MAPSTFSPDESEWLTTDEAAEMLGCARQHVVELIDTARLKASKRGTQRRIWLPDLTQFIEAENKVRETLFRKLVAQTQDFGGYRANNKSTNP